MEQNARLKDAQRERVQRVYRSLHGTAHPDAARERCDVGRRGQGDVGPPAEQIDQLLVASTPQPLGKRGCAAALRLVGAMFGHPALAAARQVWTVGRARVHVTQLV